jgi:hypothetical protein
MTKKKLMTKKEMVATIQMQEARAWLQAKRAERDFGAEDDLTRRFISKWAELHQVMDMMGIATDYELPDSQEATRILCELIERANAA